MWEIILYVNPLTVTAGILVCQFVCVLAVRFEQKGHESVTRIAKIPLGIFLGITLLATLIPSQGIGTGDSTVWVIPGQGILFDNSAMGDMERSMYILQQVANAAMFLPLGICFRFAFTRANLSTAAIAGCGLSLIIELAQWMMNAGRVVDIDDVIVNTAGAFIGALLYTLAKHFTPPQSKAAGKSPQHRRGVQL
ncbi:VanZ family protein [Streptomyces sp. NBC_00829]|uniref:VanZ family protein n=1 Tax=Streptomyces sp. NBC_00829 TaxID=2903679 RepID=UPI003866D8D2|nr:VanZ family protein [Streptomyces sp. NBC_00829]